jgi:hypothetical protein
MGEFWTGATSDFQNARIRFRQLAMLGSLVSGLELFIDEKLRFSDERSRVWDSLEEQSKDLIKHADGWRPGRSALEKRELPM